MNVILSLLFFKEWMIIVDKRIEEVHKIIDIMHNDYSGYIDKISWDNPQQLIDTVENHTDLSDYDYFKEITKYLLKFKDYHVYLNHDFFDKETIGFSTRRFKDQLIVTDTISEKRLSIGSKIVAIDGLSIPHLGKESPFIIFDEIKDRQNWENVLKFAKNITILSDDSTTKTISIQKYQITPYVSNYSFKKINSKTGLLTLSDFFDESAIEKLLLENNLDSLDKLIIDIRKNNGGSDSAYFPLFPLIFKDNETINSPVEDINFYYMNYTERNCTDRIQLLTTIEAEGVGENTQELISQIKNECLQNFGKGMTKIYYEQINIPLNKLKRLENVIVLTDKDCFSSGESFVRFLKKSDNVTVVGRNTRGCLDYSNLNAISFNNFKLMYGTSRDGLLDISSGIDCIGEKPHIFIPWTPDMLEKDIDLEVALNI